MVTPPRSGTAMTPFGSMYACSWWPARYLPSTTRSARAKPDASRPFSIRTSLNAREDAAGSKFGVSVS